MMMAHDVDPPAYVLAIIRLSTFMISEGYGRRFLSLGLLPPCKEATYPAPAPNSGRGQNSRSLKLTCPRSPLRLELSLGNGANGRSLSKISPFSRKNHWLFYTADLYYLYFTNYFNYIKRLPICMDLT